MKKEKARAEKYQVKIRCPALFRLKESWTHARKIIVSGFIDWKCGDCSGDYYTRELPRVLGQAGID